MTRPSDLDEAQAGLPKNFIRPCLLLVLAEDAGHGYELLERLEFFGFVRADPGGLYRTLRAMERDGFVRSWWETSASGPARRTYTITDEGADHLQTWVWTLRQAGRALERLLDRYDATLSGPHTLVRGGRTDTMGRTSV